MEFNMIFQEDLEDDLGTSRGQQDESYPRQGHQESQLMGHHQDSLCQDLTTLAQECYSLFPESSQSQNEMMSQNDYPTFTELMPIGSQNQPDQHRNHYELTSQDQATSGLITSTGDYVSLADASNMMYHLETVVDHRSMESIEQQMAGSMNVSDSGHFDHSSTVKGSSTLTQSMAAPQEEQKKQNHSEIEKRRREKMNSCIKELASIIPVCSGMSRKLDKLTVLRMAVQHLKTIRGNMNAFTPGSQAKPAFLSNKKMYDLILKVAEGFLFAVSCDRGKILFITESVSQVLNYSKDDLLGQNWFDVLHPKDVAKVKEQLTSYDLLTKKERYVDAKTMLPVLTDMKSDATNACHGLSAFSPGARRSFFCRMKCNSISKSKEEADTTTGLAQKKRKSASEKKYVVIHCMGYIKSWSSTITDDEDGEGNGTNGCNLSCLVAVGRTIPPFNMPISNQSSNQSSIPTESMEYVSRHAMDGKFLFVDQREVFILGYLPQELLGASNYEFCHPDDVKKLADSHRRALASKDEVISKPYRFKAKSGTYLYLQTKWKNFINPWTKEFEFLVARNTCVSVPDSEVVESSNSSSCCTKKTGYPSSGVKPPDLTVSGESGVSGGLSCLDEMIQNLSKNGQSSNEGSSGSSSETRVKKILSSSRVNLWKIGKQIAEEAIDNQRKNFENDSSSSRSNMSSNVSSPSLSNEPSEKGSGSSSCTLTTMGRGMRTTNGSDSGGSSYSGNFYGNGGSTIESESAEVMGQDAGNQQQTTSMLSTSPYNPTTSSCSHDPVLTTSVVGPSTSANTFSILVPQTTSLMPMTKTVTSGGRMETIHHPHQPTTVLPTLPSVSPTSDPSSSNPLVFEGKLSLAPGPSKGDPSVAGPSGVAAASSPSPSLTNASKDPRTIGASQDIDEAAMALVMSLLEADAGLGGPVDFSGLPWPLF